MGENAGWVTRFSSFRDVAERVEVWYNSGRKD